jgi:hypothetical protein
MSATSTTRGEPQSADAVLMIRPAHFDSNAQTATSNSFQSGSPTADDTATSAQNEFDALALALASAGVRVHLFAGRTGEDLPDEVFPNNWLSLHPDGTAVLYPLLAPNRRRERRLDVLAALQGPPGYRIERIVDLTHLETRGEYLEGTGSLVLDRMNHIAYACLSPRTHAAALTLFGRALDYEIMAFNAVDRAGRAIYHTNVLLSVGTSFAALCTGALTNATERRRVIARLEATGREIIDLDFAQLHAFAGNLLELRGRNGPLFALSAAALGSLGSAQRDALERHGALVAVAIAMIEKFGGGSVRCMLAEVALPRHAK